MASPTHCPDCRAQVRAQEKDCPTCGRFVGFPNIRAAEQPEELQALDGRYSAATLKAQGDGKQPAFTAYESALGSSVAVVCRSLDQAKALISSDSAVYTNFYHQVDSGGRRAEETSVEIRRQVTDARVFLNYPRQISFGALSLDGRGVTSYGACSLVLKPAMIAHRATVFEENTVEFCDRVCPEQTKPIPPGHRATWARRALLAVTKAEPQLEVHTLPGQFSRILMDGDRFVEVHVFGPFTRDSIDRLLIAKPTSKGDRAMVAGIRDVIQKDGLNIQVEEYT